MPTTTERTPLLAGSAVTYASTAPDVSNSQRAAAQSPYAGEKVQGLLSAADEKPADASCGEWDQSIISVLARLPFLHTFTVISFFVYFGHVWLLMQHPLLTVGIIFTLLAYGLYRFWTLWLCAFHGLFVIRKFDNRDPNYWQQQPRPASNLSFDSVWHVVMVPSYKEPIDKLRQTLDTIASQSIAKQIVVCMAMEARDPKGQEVAMQLEQEYGSRLGGFCFALHPLIAGEVAGKSSNENWAARCIKKKMVDDLRINEDNIVITTCDADTFFHPNYFAAVTHYFICDGENRYHKFYLPVTNFMPNIYAVPAVCSTRYTVLSVGRLSEMANPVWDPLPLAIYSLPMRLAYTADYWDPHVIPEDWHMYFRCVFADKGRVSPTRVMLIVGTEAVEGKDELDTVRETYDQSVRWQWGAIDLGYLIMQTFAKWDVPLLKRLRLLFTAYDHHLFAIAMGLCLMSTPALYGKIPVEVESDVWTGGVAFILVKTILLWIWISHMLLHYTFLCVSDYHLRNGVLRDRMHFYMDGEGQQAWQRWLKLLLFPIADFFLFIIPTIHAHARMFWSSQFNYVPSAKLGGKRMCPSPTDVCGGGNDDSDEITRA